MGEFALIARYFTQAAPAGMLGVGDDGAVLPVPSGRQLVVSKDLLLEGRHFLPADDPAHLGHKALAVNLSDLGAMGAEPFACLLGLAVPRMDDAWLAGFSAGLRALADEAGCPLVGGDTTASDAGICISITVLGLVASGQALRRDAARPGDDIWMAGSLGGADVALHLRLGHWPPDPDRLRASALALDRPQPPWRLGPRLAEAGLAHAAIDLSDGLLQDLGHIMAASRCGAVLMLDSLPAHPALAGLDDTRRHAALLAGGESYALCFTAPPASRVQIQALAAELAVPVAVVGRIEAQAGLAVLDADGHAVPLPSVRGHDHFASGSSR